MSHASRAALALAAVLLAGATTSAQTPTSLSLAKCQAAMAKEAEKLRNAMAKMQEATLRILAKELVQKEQTEPSQEATAKIIQQWTKAGVPGDVAKKSYDAYAIKVDKSCDPATHPHTEEDLLVKLKIEKLKAQCARVGIGLVGFQSYKECVKMTQAKKTFKAATLAYPGAPEYLAKLQETLTTAPPPEADLEAIEQAKEATAMIGEAIDANGDGTADPECPAFENPYANLVRIVFVTSISMGGGNLGGLAGADATCQTLASAAGLAGTFKAWLSSSTTSAAARLTHSPLPYVLVDGTKVADNWTDLTDGDIDSPIDAAENGRLFDLSNVFAWTGSDPSGATQALSCPIPAECLCGDWTNATNSTAGVAGTTGGTNIIWSRAGGGKACNSDYHLYCLQQ